MPKLSALATHLLVRARATGQVQRADLPKGARVSVLVVGEQVTMAFARCAKPLGDTELATFIAHCAVPAGAQRIPGEGQREITDGEGRTWHQVGYRWRDL